MIEMHTTTREDIVNIISQLNEHLETLEYNLQEVQQNAEWIAEERDTLGELVDSLSELVEADDDEFDDSDDYITDDCEDESDEDDEEEVSKEDLFNAALFSVYDIHWDIDDEEEVDEDELPGGLQVLFSEIFNDMDEFYDIDRETAESMVVDYLSDEYGYCINSCKMSAYSDMKSLWPEDPDIGSDDDEDEEDEEEEEVRAKLRDKGPVKFVIDHIEWEKPDPELPDMVEFPFSEFFDSTDEYYWTSQNDIVCMIIGHLGYTYDNRVIDCSISRVECVCASQKTE